MTLRGIKIKGMTLNFPALPLSVTLMSVILPNVLAPFSSFVFFALGQFSKNLRS